MPSSASVLKQIANVQFRCLCISFSLTECEVFKIKGNSDRWIINYFLRLFRLTRQLLAINVAQQVVKNTDKRD